MVGQTSLARVEASRKNARRSTGPRTPAGKAVVRWNALKHGLLAKEVVIRAGGGKESKSEFQNLFAKLTEDLRPEGMLEEVLVEKIAVCYWRLRRVIRCETGEIRSSLDTYEFDEDVRRIEAVNDRLSWPSLTGKGCEGSLVKTSAGVERMLKIIDGLRYDIHEHGSFCESAETEMRQVFGSQEGDLGHTLSFYNWLASEEGQHKAGADEEEKDQLTPEQSRQAILDMLAEKEEALKVALDVAEETEAFKLQSDLARLSLPAEGSAEKTLRYETAIERQMYRAINQLERLQRQRRGEPVPPSINVEVSGDD